MAPDVIVHHFSIGSSSSTSQAILDSALDLLDNSVINSAGWCDVKSPIKETQRANKSVCFQWRKVPPVIKGKGKAKYQEDLLDWDAPSGHEEAYINVIALPDFESTDISEIIERSRRPGAKRKQPFDFPSHQGPRNFADDIDMNREDRVPKRPRSINNPTVLNTSISDLIPFPHYHPSPDPACPPPAGIRLVPPFKVLRLLSQSTSLRHAFARAAWVVPLRGGPAVEGTSRAHLCSHVLSDETTLNESSPRHIQWTPAAVTQFWTFLLFQRTMNNFGPLSLAYIMSPYQSSSKKQIQSKTTGANGKPGKPSSRMKNNDRNTPTIVWEYIKVYHDARLSLKLRSLLNSFRWEDTSINQKTPSSTKKDPIKYRVLKGASLVLLDEVGEPLLLS